MRRRLRRWLRPLLAVFVVLLLGYAAIWATVWQHARALLAQPPTRTAEVALVLGNRAWLRGKPNPCLTGRVDAAVALAQAGTVQRLLMSGGVDREDGRIEAEVMERHARRIGYAGSVQLEAVSSSTRQNLSMSRALLQAAGVRSVVVVSEPYHLWRVERLARASGFDREFDVQYAAAPSSCWRSWGMVFKGALREPFAIVNNGLNGYF
ncbi:MAG: YdcF family protein [Variovorax sp.]